MRKKLMKYIAAASAASACLISVVLPVSADSSLKSRGNLIYEDGAVSFYASDFAYLYAEADGVWRGQELAQLPEAQAEGPSRKENIRSQGVLNYGDGAVIVDSSDFIRLAEQLDGLDAAYRSSTENAIEALNKIGTYFTTDGSITHESEDADTGEAAMKLPYQKICEGILQSQSVAHLKDREINAAMPNSLSRGTAAWVDGILVVGNGADNDAHYDKGYKSGEEAGYQTGYAAGVKEAETNVNTSSASYQEGYAKGKADSAPVVLTGTISDFETTAEKLKGSVQIPAGLSYVCAGMNVSECVAYVYPDVNSWRTGAGWSYDRETGLVNFVFHIGGEKHPSSNPVLDYTIMYIP
ncbi:MAG: hypothetical protein K2P23_04335 [Lachnospiraceae bacterium]|nr:hypothetical protein [Lachnospiraceae bacterium]